MKKTAEQLTEQFQGKVLDYVARHGDTVYISFEGGGQITLEMSSYNRSCSCHPEWEYELELSSDE